jgi:LPXTG-site transpeptidase (sortase) family protein
MKARNPFYVKLGLIFIVVGLSGLVLPFISFGLSEDYILLQEIAEQKQASGLFGDQFINQSLGTESSGPLPTPTTHPDPNLTNIKDRLVIPKIGVDMPIFGGDSANLLLKGGWVFPGTSRPGQKGNSVIFGHRFRFLPPITNTFYSLDKIEIGDTFSVAWQGKVYSYRIKEKKIIEPNDFSVLDQGSELEMTLVTCAPLFSTKQRLVVIGELIP